MRVLAIDPGPKQSAYLIFDLEEQRPIVFGIMENESLLVKLKAIAFAEAEHLAIEMIASFGMAVGAEVFDTCVWIGRFIEAAGIPHTRIYRLECKMHLCHNSRAKDANVRQALLDRFGDPGTKKEPGVLYGVSKDVWSALAVAVTYADTKVGIRAENA